MQGSPADLVDGLRRTYRSGATTSLEWRLTQLDGLLRMLEENADRIVEAGTADCGRPAIETQVAEVQTTVREIKHLRRRLHRWVRPTVVLPRWLGAGTSAVIRNEPLGVVLVLSPWNYPVQLTSVPLATALAGGNVVLVKPSELAPASSAVLADLIPRYVDTDAVAVMQGGPDVASQLLEQRYDHIFFTGGTRVGRIVAEAGARHLTPVTLELGGQNPVIVDRDVAPSTAARRIAWGRFFNAGQTCLAPNHVLVHEAVKDELVHELVRAVEQMYGTDPRQSPHYGRIVNDGHFERLVRLIDGGGYGHVATGGQHDRAERYIAPSVFCDVKPDAPMRCEEIFGPLLPIVTVGSVDEAIAVVDEGEAPLALYAFSRDREVVSRILRGTRSGGACVNDVMFQIVLSQLPLAGVGHSGMGAYHGRSGFIGLTHQRSVVTRPFWQETSAYRPPYKRWKRWVMGKAL